MTRHRIVATRQVSCHRRIPVIQQAITNRKARLSTSIDLGLAKTTGRPGGFAHSDRAPQRERATLR
jgi:hypothetical protein